MDVYRLENRVKQRTRLPSWMRKRLQDTQQTLKIKRMLKHLHLHTVCQSASCPNMSECFQNSTVTFLIMGDVCTRNCRFCGVSKGKPLALDPDEPKHICDAVGLLQLKHVVITSVTRDDLEDGGALHFAKTVEAIRVAHPKVTIEVLIPDFQGKQKSLEIVISSGIHVLNHNVETVPRLYSSVRPMANFEQSVQVIKMSKLISTDVLTKSGLMVGLGETPAEMDEVFKTLSNVKCDMLTIGQYLSPSQSSFPVKEYVHPDQFKLYEERAKAFGIPWVQSGPFVRSSYQAADAVQQINEGVS